MNTFRQLAYSLLCAAGLIYLAVSNARGYVPFAASAARSTGGSHMYFHK